MYIPKLSYTIDGIADSTLQKGDLQSIMVLKLTESTILHPYIDFNTMRDKLKELNLTESYLNSH
jgi:hypothetical protein